MLSEVSAPESWGVRRRHRHFADLRFVERHDVTPPRASPLRGPHEHAPCPVSMEHRSSKLLLRRSSKFWKRATSREESWSFSRLNALQTSGYLSQSATLPRGKIAVERTQLRWEAGCAESGLPQKLNHVLPKKSCQVRRLVMNHRLLSATIEATRPKTTETKGQISPRGSSRITYLSMGQYLVGVTVGGRCFHVKAQ